MEPTDSPSQQCRSLPSHQRTLLSITHQKKNHGATDTIHPLQQYWAQGITLTSKIPNNPPKASLPCTAPPSPPLMTSHPIIQSLTRPDIAPNSPPPCESPNPTRPTIAPNSPPPCESPTPTRPAIAPNSSPPCESPTKLAIDQLLANIARKGTDERKYYTSLLTESWVCWTHLNLMQYSNPLPPPTNQLGIPSIAQSTIKPLNTTNPLARVPRGKGVLLQVLLSS